MLRNALGSIALATAALMAVPAGPAEAVERHNPLEGVAVHPEWGSITGHSGVLKRGCRRTYSYEYDIHPPDGVWALEVFISGPGGEHLANDARAEGADPEKGSFHYKLCRYTTKHGRFTIEAKLSVDDGYGNITEGQLPPDHYRLRRPHRR